MPVGNSAGRLVAADVVRTPEGIAGTAVAMSGGVIEWVGDVRDPGSHVVDRYPGATIIAGLRDAHLHPIGYTAALHLPSLKDAADFSEITEILRSTAIDRPPGAAVTALRLDDESLAEGRLPDRHLLDRAVGDRPTLLVRYCGHVSVANTAALRLAGVGPDTPNPPGGVIDRDDRGIPTGVLRETASDLVSVAVRSAAAPVGAEQVVASAHALASVGLTGIGAIVSVEDGCWAGNGSELDALVDAAPGLPIDMGVLVIASSPEDLRQAARRIDRAGGRLRFLGWKAFSDGSLGGHTAAMHEPFSDRSDTSGTDRLDPDWATLMARTSLDLGGRVAIHAIGDAANGSVLDLMESLIAEGADPRSMRVEHASVLTPVDINRFARLGITACVQPAFLSSETTWLMKRLGPERIRRAYPFRSLIDSGATLAGSSDCPVEPPHPLWGMATARDRAGIVPEEGLTAVEALALFTTASADAIGADASLRAGGSADLTVIDVDPVTATPAELRDARVLATYVGGVRVSIDKDATVWAG